MKLKYLGTGAAEGVPALFCECDICIRSMEAGGKNIRTRSQAIIDNTLLIDFPSDTYLHYLRDKIPFSKIHSCLVTHNHSDHLAPYELEIRRPNYAHLSDQTPLTVYGTAPACNDVMQIQKAFRGQKEGCVECKVIVPFIPFEVEGYTVTALRAKHDQLCDPVFYLIEKDGQTILYANDTGYFPEATWAYLEQHKPQLNLVSLDCTSFLKEPYTEHMGLVSANKVKQRLLDAGLADEDTKFYLNHFSHNGGATYDEMAPLAAEYGMHISYDGLEVDTQKEA